MRRKYLLMAILCCFFTPLVLFAQWGFSHEIGIISGPVAFQSDYGIRNNFDTNSGNVGFGVGIVHYLNFSYNSDCNCYSRDTYFNDHFKVRNEIDFHFTNLSHFGEPSESDTDEGRDLRDMTGSSSVFEIGTQLEYFPLSIRDFAAGAFRVAPYVSLGIHFVNFKPEAMSSQGEITPTATDVVFDPFLVGDGIYGGIDDSARSTFAITWSAGIRYKISPLSDLVMDARWHWFDSNWVDGLNPSNRPQNRANDWIFWLNVGYIYYL